MGGDHARTIEQLFNQGGLNAAWRYAKKGVVIEIQIFDPTSGKEKIYALENVEGKAVVREGKPEKPDALCTMTPGALEYLTQAEDYVETGRRIYEMRVYPTEERKLVWETLVTAIEAYEKLFVFYRKLGMN
jgi:hypothetical protein